MAILFMVAVRDRAANTFARPFCVPAIAVAVRTFTDEVNRNEPENPLWKHPEDYDLYQVGAFDEDDGQISGDKPKMICVGKEVSQRNMKKGNANE